MKICKHQGRTVDERVFCKSKAVSASLVLLSECDVCVHKETDSNTNEPTLDGPGTLLKRYLKRLGFDSDGNCQCERRMREMNVRGVEWCEEHVDEIVTWLREEAARRGVIFYSDFAAKIIVSKAIKNAKNSKP